MNKPLWSFAFLVCLSGCFSLQLKNLCQEDHFTYAGILVNAVHLEHKKEFLKKVRDYAIDPYELCEEDSEAYREHKNTILGIKRKYNQLVMRVYSDRYLNDAKTNRASLDAEEKQIDEWIGELSLIGFKLGRCIDKKFVDKMDSIKGFFSSLQPFLNRRFPNSDQLFLVPNEGEDYYSYYYSDMVNDIKNMRSNLDAGQVGAFVKEFDTDVFRKRLLAKPKFDFIRKSKIIYDFDSYLIRNYDVVYPFHIEQFDDSRPCLKAADLSPFFIDEEARKPYN